jgi:predicted enzyme related to lactoylglutathione lyase
MEMQSYQHGGPSWVDLGTPDLAAASAFYSGLFGWQVETGPPESGGYSIATLRGKPVAGLGPQMNPGPPVWATYVNVESADAVVTLAGEAGGQVIMPPMDVLDAGRMAIFADPVGAVISVWQPGNHPGAGLVNEPGTYGWSELLTTDIEKSKAFYASVFGWDARTSGDDPQAAYTEWQIDGRSVGGMMLKPPMLPAEVPPHWNVYFVVPDADAAVERVRELGGSLRFGPMDIEPGRFAVVVDPTGAAFNVMALRPELAQA